MNVLVLRLREAKLVGPDDNDSELARELSFLQESVTQEEYDDFLTFALTSHLTPREIIESLPSHRDVRNQYETMVKGRAEIMELGSECPKCHHMTLVPIDIQRRRADEPASAFNRCDNCGFQEYLGE